MTTPAGPAPKPNAPAQPQPDYLERARELEADAQQFTKTDLWTWYGALDALDPGGVDQSVELILRRWGELNAARSALPSFVFQPPEFDRADQAVDVARRTIGNVVTLQCYANRSVLGGHYETFPVPEDPTTYVLAEQQKATHAISCAASLIAILSHPADGTELSEVQAIEINVLLHKLPNEMAYNFVMTVLQVKGLDKKLWSITGQARTDVLALHEKLQEQAVITHDGKDGEATPEVLAQMQRDADELDEAVHRWIVSDDHVNRILAHYPNEAQRELFFKLLEHRNLLDAILHRADTKHVEGELHETKGFEQREYNATFNTSRSIGEQAKYVGAEMARQTPGALCHVAAGVFNGLSQIPLVGGVFGRSAAAFDDLATEADAATGAWNDKTAMAWRNGLSKLGGTLLITAASMGASAELEGATGARAAYDAAETGYKLEQLNQEVQAVGAEFSNAKLLYQSLLGSVDLIPQIQTAISTGDFKLGADAVSSYCDQLISQWSGNQVAAKTDRGLSEDERKDDVKLARLDHYDAVTSLGKRLQDAGAGAPLSSEELVARTQRVRETYEAVQEVKTAPAPKQGFRVWARDTVTSVMYSAAAATLKLIKNAIVAGIEHLAVTPPHRRAQDLKEWIIMHAVEAAPGVAAGIDHLLQTLLVKGGKAALDSLLPRTIPRDQLEIMCTELVGMVDQAVGGQQLVQQAIDALVRDLARKLEPDGTSPALWSPIRDARENPS